MKLEDIQLPEPTKPVDEKNWELETWRKEYPMDYLKSACILNRSKDARVQAEIFETIYQVAQLHVPNILNKYISLSDDNDSNEKRFDTLQKKKLYLSEVKAFNDPFDCKAFYYDPEALRKYEELSVCSGRLIDDFSSFHRVVALTANGVQSMPMWAHYANNHAGFCVSYDMDDRENSSFRSYIFPVQYTDQRIDITSVMDSYAQLLQKAMKSNLAGEKRELPIEDLTIVYLDLLLCNIKHSSWSYENEFRCVAGTKTPGMPYIDAKPKELYIGMRCKDEHVKRLCDIGKELNIPVYRMELNEISEGFQLTAKKMDFTQ